MGVLVLGHSAGSRPLVLLLLGAGLAVFGAEGARTEAVTGGAAGAAQLRRKAASQEGLGALLRKPYWEPKLDAPPATQAPLVNSTEATPTGQPPSRGQDSQMCAFVELPDDLMLAPKLADKFVRHGNWQTVDGAEFADWTQDLFSWSYDLIYLNAAGKMLASLEVIRDVEAQLPGFNVHLTEKKEGPYTTVAVKDCAGQLLYVFHEHKDSKHNYRIFNRDEKLVAQIVGGNLFYDQMHIYDDKMVPMAISQSPWIVEDSFNMHIRNRPDAGMGGVPSYELRFIPGYNSNSSMMLPQNRWVIAAAIQERACRNALRFDGGYPAAYPWFVGLLVFFFLVLVGSLLYLLHMMFRCVYPKFYPEIENVFLQSTVQKGQFAEFSYGSGALGAGSKGR